MSPPGDGGRARGTLAPQSNILEGNSPEIANYKDNSLNTFFLDFPIFSKQNDLNPRRNQNLRVGGFDALNPSPLPYSILRGDAPENICYVMLCTTKATCTDRRAQCFVAGIKLDVCFHFAMQFYTPTATWSGCDCGFTQLQAQGDFWSEQWVMGIEPVHWLNVCKGTCT